MEKDVLNFVEAGVAENAFKNVDSLELKFHEILLFWPNISFLNQQLFIILTASQILPNKSSLLSSLPPLRSHLFTARPIAQDEIILSQFHLQDHLIILKHVSNYHEILEAVLMQRLLLDVIDVGGEYVLHEDYSDENMFGF